MPIIDPDGYFGGDRFDMVSDSARMVWPSFFLASNTVARIELNYYKVIAKAFYKWKKKPTEAQFWAWVQEFRDAYLLFVYETEDGQAWGQWDTSEKFLVRHKLAADLRSPAPTARDFLDWKNEYISTKKSKSIASNNFVKLAQVTAGLRGNVRGGGGGGGNGNGEEKSKAEAQAPLSTSKPSKSCRFERQPLPDAWLSWAIKKRRWTQEQTLEVYEIFSDHWISKAGPDASKIDWLAAWRMWVRREREPTAQSGLSFKREGSAQEMMRVSLERINKGDQI